ncbi:MAG TPA: bifunctional [glutamine synthetase] adenylyltransferase/[glutamine synthetase]-adenylyl-L-tyrosine phosphorylase [Caulobacteraceae bacterium]|nr:bifunctional [glutamine synthetase] adenylyltransferase/[glutamine synthetase]-adenylyl-L-tyrosine phosphorylase [Caulobacteraceae bacterium]
MAAELAALLDPCGPVVDAEAAERARQVLAEAARDGGWSETLALAWPALAPVFAASPYLAALATRDPARLEGVLGAAPQANLARILAATARCAHERDLDAAAARLRRLKSRLHLLVALADLGGLWSLDQVTGALSRFADAAVAAALVLAAREAVVAGRLTSLGTGPEGPVPGLFVIAMGKHGAHELNYSSDIDITVFHEAGAMPIAPGLEPDPVAVRLTDRMASLLQARTEDGYVFRVDLRLRPDPASTRVAVPVAAAFGYYESVGQNWERAALIKARTVAGDMPRGEAFLAELAPFIWRRNLDFAAIADIHSIKRQIHAHKVDDRLSAAGADLKLGRGGIREIEFFVQTQQLILGGRHRDLRSPRTLDALQALAGAGQVAPDAAADMARAYEKLRGWEHRVQMVADEQTHRLPQAPAERRAVACLAGHGALRAFDAEVARTLRRVNQIYGALFAGEEALSSRFGSLIFTGVEDDPETLATLARMGFPDPAPVSRTIRAWHHGVIGATRSERGRELFTRLAPRLLEAAAATGAPDKAFARFADFFCRLASGVQVQSLFLAQPRLLELVVRIMAFAPRFATTLARHPAALDALLDPGFFGPVAGPADVAHRIEAADGFEAAMDLARRIHREHAFRIAVQVLEGVAGAETAGAAFTDLAEALIGALAGAALAEVERTAGAMAGEAAVIALGKCGSREMTAQSDLDLMTLYRPAAADTASARSGLSADTFYARFTQRLIAALSVFTTEGGLYEVDLQLRPSGTKGPVAVSLAAFEDYYAASAETWELLAMTRARVVWATSPAFAADAEAAIAAALRRPRREGDIAADVMAMRTLMAEERPASGFWDMKLSDGGLVDIEFAAQHLQLVHAAEGGPLRPNTDEALRALAEAHLAAKAPLVALHGAWVLQQDISQLLKIALEDGADPGAEPKALRALLARAAGARDFRSMKASLAASRRAALAASRAVIAGARVSRPGRG